MRFLFKKCALLLLLTWSSFSFLTAQTTHTVCASDCDFTTITDAIVGATSGDIISITDAVHTEQGIVVDKDLTINGTPSAGSIIQAHATIGSATDRVFTINAGITVVMNALTIQHGNTTDSGGGIYNQGILTQTNCTVSDNSASLSNYSSGGGILNTGTLTQTNCTISGNSCYFNFPSGGAGISSSGTLTQTNCTISENFSHTFYTGYTYFNGVGIFSSGTLTQTNCTISGNYNLSSFSSSGGGIYIGGGTVNIINTIIANNSASSNPNLYGTPTSSTNSICEGCTTGTWTSTADPMIGSLADNGGLTQTIAITDPSSPAINAGTSTGAPTLDQAGQVREGAVDIGAFEYQVSGGGIINMSGHTVCGLNCDFTTITAAIAGAAAGDTITITDAVHTEQGIIVDKSLTIQSGNENGTIVQANPQTNTASDRVFTINSGVTVIMNNLTIQHGKTTDNGGGIYNQGILTQTNCTIRKNSASFSDYSSGGGIFNTGTLTQTNCTISRNSCHFNYPSRGGGIYSSGTLTQTNCTISKNFNYAYYTGYTYFHGGGIYSSGTLTQTNCTISGNYNLSSSSSSGGGIYIGGGTVNIINTIIANNSASSNPNLYGTPTSSTNSICEGCTTGTWTSTADPMLGTLTNNGGLTQTIAIADPNSPAINAGTNAGAPVLDQRGSLKNGIRDIGAYEYNALCPCCEDNPIPTLAGTYTSAYSKTEGSWTNFCDADGNLLLSLDTTGSSAVIATDEVTLNIGSNTTDFYLQDCGVSPACFIDLPDGGITFNRSWDVSPTTQPSSGNVGVKYYFTQAEYDSVNARIQQEFTNPIQLTGKEQLWFYKVTDGSLGIFPAITDIEVDDVQVIFNGATPGTDEWVLHTKTVGSEFAAEYEVTSFSGGGGGGASGGLAPLPIELIYFHAYADGENTQLKWSTASEINNRGFDIQHSLDGVSWKKIGYVMGNGNTTTVSNYDFVHEEPTEGINYYRLKQFDLDGKFELLPVKTVDFKSDENGVIQVFPNPAKDFLNITNVKGVGKIYNVSGQLVMEANLTEDGINSVDVSNLGKGVFHIVLIKNNGEHVVKRFMK